MRHLPLLVFSFAALLPGLLAQGPAARPESQPNRPSTAVEAAALHEATAQRDRLGNRAPTEVRFDRPRADGPLWAMGTAWKASFDAEGMTVVPFFGSAAPQNFPLRLAIANATVGGEPLALVGGEPHAVGQTVRSDRGALTEVVDTRLDHIEQSFVFETLPNRGAVRVEVRIDTELSAMPIAGGLRFGNAFGHVDYTKAIAVDNKGQRLPLDIVWTGTSARMEIPAEFVARAELPLVLDPVLNYWYLLASGQTMLQHDSDVASFQQGGGRTLLVWQRQWSLTDQDCWGLMFDGNLGLVRTDFPIDFTTDDWLKVAVASSNYAQNFLVVSEIRIGVVWFIGGRLVDGSGTPGSVFDIERDGVVGLPGNNFHPDVGGDPYFGVGRYCVVFHKRTLTTSDIYKKDVTTTGGLVAANPVALDTSSSEESKPAISKSCGQSNGQPAHWLLTWQRTWVGAPNDQEVYGRFVNWNGGLVGNLLPIAYTVAEESAPSPGSPIDLDGVRYWPLVHEHAPVLGQPRTLLCRLLRADGTQAASTTASNNVPAADYKAPEIDSDGTRFVIAYGIGQVGVPDAVEAVTLAYLPASGTFRVEERTGLVTSSLENYAACNVCADYSGGSAMTPRYLVSFTEQATNTFRLEAFAGHTGSTNFFATRPSQCGNLPISASGSPVIGQTVTVSASSGGFSGTLIGFPGYAPINAGCSCWLGVDQGISMPNPMVWNVPNVPAYVGITLAVQAWSFAGAQCFGQIDLSDTVDFTIR